MEDFESQDQIVIDFNDLFDAFDAVITANEKKIATAKAPEVAEYEVLVANQESLVQQFSAKVAKKIEAEIKERNLASQKARLLILFSPSPSAQPWLAPQDFIEGAINSVSSDELESEIFYQFGADYCTGAVREAVTEIENNEDANIIEVFSRIPSFTAQDLEKFEFYIFVELPIICEAKLIEATLAAYLSEVDMTHLVTILEAYVQFGDE